MRWGTEGKLLAEAQDLGDELRRVLMRKGLLRASLAGSQGGLASGAVGLSPRIERVSRDAVEAAGLRDVAGRPGVGEGRNPSTNLALGGGSPADLLSAADTTATCQANPQPS